MKDDFITKTIFCERFNALKTPNSNQYGYDGMSIVHDLLNVISIFSLGNEVTNMVERGHMYGKSVEEDCVGPRAHILGNRT